MAIALFAILLGALQFLLAKGGLRHRIFGRIWSGLIITVCLSSLFIHETLPGAQRFMGYSPLHLFSLAVGLCLPTGLWAARQGRVALHRTMMLACFAGALVMAALFSLTPGRLIYKMIQSSPAPLVAGAERAADASAGT
jgi:uncharacterized membrane protein